MHITDLGGHSGCSIFLCETNDNEVFVRKVSESKNYNKRLEKQANKQESYRSKVIKTPRILNRGYDSKGLFFFDMEYIYGITLAEYMKSIEIGKVRNLVQAIVMDVVHAADRSTKCDELIFYNKIQSLKQTLQSKNNIILNEAIEKLEGHSWNKFYFSECHGDLTLENIIIKDNELYFIDFLDSFYDCWLLDIASLLQDVQSLWAYRFEDDININTLIRLIVFRDILLDEISQVAPNMKIEIYFALLLKLIRIIPYTKDNKTYNFLIEKVETVLNIISQEK